METYVLYLYRSLINDYPPEKSLLQLGQEHPLVAIIQNNLQTVTRLQQIKRFKLQPFEIIQSNYDFVLINSKSMSIRILDIEFDEIIDTDLKYDLINAVNTYQFDLVENILNEIRDETDIESISFLFKDRNYKVSKYGIVEVDADFNELFNLAVNSPVAVITGIKKWSPELISQL